MLIVVRLSFSRMHAMMQMYEELIFSFSLLCKRNVFFDSLQVYVRLISCIQVASLIPLQEYLLCQVINAWFSGTKYMPFHTHGSHYIQLVMNLITIQHYLTYVWSTLQWFYTLIFLTSKYCAILLSLSWPLW